MPISEEKVFEMKLEIDRLRGELENEKKRSQKLIDPNPKSKELVIKTAKKLGLALVEQQTLEQINELGKELVELRNEQEKVQYWEDLYNQEKQKNDTHICLDNAPADLPINWKTDKESVDAENTKLKNQLALKQAEIDKLKGWKQQAKPSSLIDEINQKIIQAYNSQDYLNGYYEKLMKAFLSWEYSSDKEKQQAVKKMKININKCLTFLEEISKVRNNNDPF